ncbi:hypothetical protein [uncultured Campylobacter sp.]|uniref:hypothetical protein n=1 Tax=uncultured Campylobacter sp. TaxID=218934 RepID=UPI00261383AA|nr:hypothetical protein [uncultured Campylobacter sp.]
MPGLYAQSLLATFRGVRGGDNIEKFKAEIEDKGLSYLSVMGAIDAAIEAERSKK